MFPPTSIFAARRVRRKRHELAPSASPPPPPPPPLITSVVVNTTMNTIEVTFDQAVTWNGDYSIAFLTDTGGAVWSYQVAPNKLKGDPQCGTLFTVGAGWSWGFGDETLSPTPDVSQTGVCS